MSPYEYNEHLRREEQEEQTKEWLDKADDILPRLSYDGMQSFAKKVKDAEHKCIQRDIERELLEAEMTIIEQERSKRERSKREQRESEQAQDEESQKAAAAAEAEEAKEKEKPKKNSAKKTGGEPKAKRRRTRKFY